MILILIADSVNFLALALYKLWRFRGVGVKRHPSLTQAVEAWERGDRAGAAQHLARSSCYSSPVMRRAFGAGRADGEQLMSEAEVRFARLERSLRTLDNAVKLAPLLGFFGPVLGIVEAFQALQSAESQVDPARIADTEGCTDIEEEGRDWIILKNCVRLDEELMRDIATEIERMLTSG